MAGASRWMRHAAHDQIVVTAARGLKGDALPDAKDQGIRNSPLVQGSERGGRD